MEPNEVREGHSITRLLDHDWSRLLEVSGRPDRPRRLLDSFSPRFAAVVLVRIAWRLHAQGWRTPAKFVSFLNFVLFGLEVAVQLDIGGGLVLPHTHGTVIGAASIGPNVTIFQQVTLGARTADFSYDRSARPRIRAGAVISAGAKVLGPVEVGEEAVVGANAVVLEDVPAACLAVGVPARIIPRSGSGL